MLFNVLKWFCFLLFPAISALILGGILLVGECVVSELLIFYDYNHVFSTFDQQVLSSILNSSIKLVSIFAITIIFRSRSKIIRPKPKLIKEKIDLIKCLKNVTIIILSSTLACSLVALFNSGGRAPFQDKGIVVFINLVIFTPLLEEFFFRRLYFKVLSSLSMESAFLNTLCFILVHFMLDPVAFSFSFVVLMGSVVFITVSLVYVKFKSYYAAVITHSSINAYLYFLRNTDRLSVFIDNHILYVMLIAIISGGLLFVFIRYQKYSD